MVHVFINKGIYLPSEFVCHECIYLINLYLIY